MRVIFVIGCRAFPRRARGRRGPARVHVSGYGVAPLSIMPLISLKMRLIRAPSFGQPPRWCSAITLFDEPARTGEPELPGEVSHR